MPAKATAYTLLAVVLWSILGYIGMTLQAVPALLTTGLSLTISGILFGIISGKTWRQASLKTWLVGIGGIFGYHALYFSAFQNAPAVEVNLMNYLWPLFIVVLTPLILPGNKLLWNHIIGALLGFFGAGLIVTGGRWSLDFGSLTGYVMAASAALIWALYSLLTKRLPPFPSSLVGGFCLAAGLLSLGIFAVQGGDLKVISTLSLRDWFLIVLAALGPLGWAFFFWDAALKMGDSRIIGSLAYLIPLLSTAILVFAGGKQMNWVSAAAMVMIVGGALLGSLHLFTRGGKNNHGN